MVPILRWAELGAQITDKIPDLVGAQAYDCKGNMQAFHPLTAVKQLINVE